MKKKTLIIAAGSVVAIAGVAAFMLGNGEEKALEVQTVPAERHEIVQKVNATGKVQPKTQVKISADVSAKIISLHVEEGDTVEAGQLLAELDRERYLAAVESAEANVSAARANAKLVQENRNKAEKEYRRSRELVERKLESQSVLDTVEAAYQVEVARYESALEGVAQAQAALKQAEDDLSKTTIYAPMSGVISDLRKEQGEIAIGSQFQEDVIMIVSDLSAMEAQVNVDENDIVAVEIGDRAEIEVDALLGRTLPGRVAEIANSANMTPEGSQDQKTEFEVKITIIDPVAELRPGMTASADIITHTKDSALAVPIQSVAVRSVQQLEAARESGTEFEPDEEGFVELVFVIEGGKAVARQVTTGIQSQDYIEIVSGVEEGDVVVSGNYRAISRDLQHGTDVLVNNDAEGPASERG